MTEQSLYDRLGGINAIASVVNRFSDKIVTNPNLNRNPALTAWNGDAQMAGLKFMRTLWLCQEAGGPFQYPGDEAGDAHKHLQVNHQEFNEVGVELSRALEYFNVQEREKLEVLAAVISNPAAVING